MFYSIKRKIRYVSNKNKFIKEIYLLANRIKIKLLAKLSDETFAKIVYKENTGRKLDLKNPTTFNEKLWWLKLNNRDPLLTICSDKYKVREYVKSCGLEHILTKLYGVYDNAEDINFDELPPKAFIKTNHGSGMNIIWDKNKPFNISKFRKKFNKALKQNYYWQSREWNYKNIEPKIIVEEFLEDSPFVDYKFMCFDGKVKLVFAEIGICDADGTHNPFSKRNVYDRNFNYLNIKVGREQFDKSLISKPKNFDKMIEYAEILSKPFPHCRVDLYNINGKIYFGEITFYHGGGYQKITPVEWDKRMGDWINLNSDKIKLKNNKH